MARGQSLVDLGGRAIESDGGTPHITVKLIGSLLLILANGLFVAAEFSMVKVRSTRLQQLVEEGNKRARRAQLLVAHVDEFLSATQLGITLASLALGWIGEPAVAAVLVWPLAALARLVPAMGIEVLVHTIAFVVAYSFITTLHIVLGELVPKSMAIAQAERVVLFCAWPMLLFHRAFRWPVGVLNRLAGAVLRGVRFVPASEQQLSHSSEELRRLLSDSAKAGQLDEQERVLLDNVFEFSERTARQLMVPRNEMDCLFMDDPVSDSVARAMDAGYSRVPLCQGDKDKVVGMIHLRDLLQRHHQITNLRQIMRPMLMVPETISVPRLLKAFQRQNSQMAVLVDEYGGTAGLITLDDLLEEIVGHIPDEFDHEAADVRPVDLEDSGVEGSLRLAEVHQRLGLALDDVEGVDTIGGYILAKLGAKPEAGQELLVKNGLLQITEVDGFRVKRVKVVLRPAEEAADDPGIV